MTLKLSGRTPLHALAAALLLASLPAVALAQGSPKILEGDELTRVVPSSFYFEGQSAPTQMRNAAAVQSGARLAVQLLTGAP